MKYRFIVVIVLLAFASGCVQSPVGVSSSNGSNFSLNLTAHPVLTTIATIDCGVNMTCDQVGTVISLDSLGTGSGDTNNYYNYTNYTNLTLNSSSCAANEVLRNYDNGTGWECVTNDHTGFLTSETDTLAFANISSNMDAWLNTSNSTYSEHIENTSAHTDSDNISQFTNDAGYVTNDTGDFVKRTGDNMTGNLKVSGDIILTKNFEVQNNTDSLILGGFDFYESQAVNQPMARFLAGRGYIKATNTIIRGKYGNVTKGYTFQVSSEPPDLSLTEGIRYRYFPVNSTTATQYFFSNEENTTIQLGNFTVSTLVGSGNDYGCLNSAGTLYRDPTGCS